MYAVLHGTVPAEVATPEFIEKTITGASWVLLMPATTNPGPRRRGKYPTNIFETGAGGVEYESRAFPSPVDLCESDGYKDGDKVEIFDALSSKKACYEAAREVRGSPLLCFLLHRPPEPATVTVRSAGSAPYSFGAVRNNTLACMEALGISPSSSASSNPPS